MALPSSGPISIGNIVTEKGGTPTVGGNYSLSTLSTTNINEDSTFKPDGIAPHAISEFYQYNHTAVPPLPELSITLGTLSAGTPSFSDACPPNIFDVTQLVYYVGPTITVGSQLFLDDEGLAVFNGQNKWWGEFPQGVSYPVYLIDGDGFVLDIESC